MTKFIILLTLLLSACSGLAPEVAPEATDAGSEYTSCWCCVWQSGTGYPDGNVACLLGDIAGDLCYAAPAQGANLPAWAPASTVCPADDPWSGETSNGNMMAD